MKDVAVGVCMLFAGHAVAVVVAWLITSGVPLNAHILVNALLGLIQLVYAVPMVLILLKKGKRRVALGVVAGAALTGVLSAIGLSL